MSTNPIKFSLPLGFAVPEGKVLKLRICQNVLEWSCDGKEYVPFEFTTPVSKITIHGVEE